MLEPVLAGLARDELIVDLRSGSYAALGRLPGAVEVDVVSEHADGHRTVVSHFNKAHKGKLARALAGSRSEPTDAAGVAAVARRAGLRVERRGNELTVVVCLWGAASVRRVGKFCGVSPANTLARGRSGTG